MKFFRYLALLIGLAVIPTAVIAGTGYYPAGGGGGSVTFPITAAQGGTGANNTATTGTVLRGNGTNFVTSTATYPDTVSVYSLLYATGTNTIGQLLHDSTAGRFVMSNGSGGVTYSQMALPYSTSGTGTFLRTSGANNVLESTYSLPSTAGTSGNVLTSNGTNFVSQAPSAPALTSSPTYGVQQLVVPAIATSTSYAQIGLATTITYTDSNNAGGTSLYGINLTGSGTTPASASFTTTTDFCHTNPLVNGPIVKVRCRPATVGVSSWRTVVGISDAPATSLGADDPTVNQAVFRHRNGDTNWFTITNDNSGGGQIIDTGIAYVSGNVVELTVDATTNTAVKFYINGTLASTHNATNPPGGNLGYGLIAGSRALTGVSGVSFDGSTISVIQP